MYGFGDTTFATSDRERRAPRDSSGSRGLVEGCPTARPFWLQSCWLGPDGGRLSRPTASWLRRKMHGRWCSAPGNGRRRRSARTARRWVVWTPDFISPTARAGWPLLGGRGLCVRSGGGARSSGWDLFAPTVRRGGVCSECRASRRPCVRGCVGRRRRRSVRAGDGGTCRRWRTQVLVGNPQCGKLTTAPADCGARSGFLQVLAHVLLRVANRCSSSSPSSRERRCTPSA